MPATPENEEGLVAGSKLSKAALNAALGTRRTGAQQEHDEDGVPMLLVSIFCVSVCVSVCVCLSE